MSMADDKTLRSYRSNDPYRRSANQTDAQDTIGGGDPLAELARLIGQPDPFHDMTRQSTARQNTARHDTARHATTHHDRAHHDTTRRQQPQAAAASADDAGDWRTHVQRPNYDEPAYDPDPRYAPDDLDRAIYQATAQQYGHQEQYADPRADEGVDPGHEPSYAAADYRDEPIYADAQHRAGYADEPYHAGIKLPREDYDDPPRQRRSGSSLATAVVLIGCAMLGTAGAYGYRTYSNSSGSDPAPVIIADSAPSKIVPSSEQKSARSQDRVGQGDEQLVSREEQPVSLPGTSSSPRVVSPWPVQPAPTTTGTTPSPTAQSSMADQPKRVRTVPIRPDSGDTSGRPTNETASRTAPPPSTRASRDAPLSLDPVANEPSRTQQRPSAPAARETAQQPPARVAALPPATSTANGNGGYLVQVSSQRSEADAQSSYKGLQAKYSQLKSKQAIIRRADLGSKGVYYRAMVGPFESSDEAGQFCSGLKQAGGQCIILRN